jgi:hypothetical protein
VLETEHRNAKLLASALAASALVGMGAFALASHQASMGTVSTQAMSLGQTTTSTVPPSTMAVPVASPSVKAPRPKGF